MTRIFRIALLAIFTTLSVPVAAQDYQVGLNAANAGDFATALENWLPLAKRGEADAQNNIGAMYGRGDGVTQDYAEAVRWYRMAAKQGDAVAQNNLGAMYAQGRGVINDHVSAHMWFNIASANGYKTASDLRDKIENSMTREQIAEAQALARGCMVSGYRDCD